MLATEQYDLVFGDDWMALYRNGHLEIEGVKLTFGDILEACNIPCEFHSANIEWAHNKMGYPAKLKEIPMDDERLLQQGKRV